MKISKHILLVSLSTSAMYAMEKSADTHDAKQESGRIGLIWTYNNSLNCFKCSCVGQPGKKTLKCVGADCSEIDCSPQEGQAITCNGVTDSAQPKIVENHPKTTILGLIRANPGIAVGAIAVSSGFLGYGAYKVAQMLKNGR